MAWTGLSKSGLFHAYHTAGAAFLGKTEGVPRTWQASASPYKQAV